ncbi:hypothetical protein GGD66_006985 [Bradyrhizobium sp. CIR48]|uniref:hypothetical protein n=1 Tax=Bradyrhizobium sp. CIR48 TaxID=2663840 RepID=UPI001605F6E6|nr:hypothetical protein [Bradyrhizobium sp. CIR48]MBB4428398.1 hypothetical protein [Bradyrhizobium sp. CIR48]
MRDLIIEAFDSVIRREIAEADDVRKEIAQRGAYWAGDELWKLRRQVAALRKRIAELEDPTRDLSRPRVSPSSARGQGVRLP